MATVKITLGNKRTDHTRLVQIRIIHNRLVRRIGTTIYVTPAQLTKSLKIKDHRIIDACDDILRRCRKILFEIRDISQSMDADTLTEYVKDRLEHGDKWRLDFIQYGYLKSTEMTKGTGGITVSALNALKRFVKSDHLDISQITAKFLLSFERFLKDEPSQRGSNRNFGQENCSKGNRAVSLYTGRIRALFNQAKSEFNDEDLGIIRIPGNPFSKYKIKSEYITRKRALTVEEIQKIIDFEPSSKRAELAKDCFIISFCLIGMNAVDLYLCSKPKGNELIYFRQKTASRREDRAEMHVLIPEQIIPLLKKYAGREMMFSFSNAYSTAHNFSRALNVGMKRIGSEIGVDNLTFYAARHSWATIARSSLCGVDKTTVHEALNHVDEKMKVTDIYIKKDWTMIWEANRKVLSLFRFPE